MRAPLSARDAVAAAWCSGVRGSCAGAQPESTAHAIVARSLRMDRTSGRAGLLGSGVRVAHRAHRHELRADLLLDLTRNGLVVAQELARIVLALADALALVAVPGAGFFDDAVRASELDDLAFAGDALPVHDFELGFAERR